MGLFGKKEKKPEAALAVFYEGDIPGLSFNDYCAIELTDDAIMIRKGKPQVEIRLDRQRVLGIDIFLQEAQYMTKYKGTNITMSKSKAVPKHYYVINYIDKNGDKKHVDFWGTSSETGKMSHIRTKILETQKPITYEI